MSDAKTTSKYWDSAWAGEIRLRLPSPLFVNSRNVQTLLRANTRPGDRFLEIGCAPGKHLAWVAAKLKAECSGIDYSERGVKLAQRLFQTLGLRGDIRCEDVFATSFADGTFDVVYSGGLIEHFDDPRAIVKKHVDLLKPGGRALMVIPHFGGVWGRIQSKLDPANLAIHNTVMMNPAALAALAPEGTVARAYPAGRLSSALLSLSARYPSWLAWGIHAAANTVGLLQPFDIEAIAPLLVLEIRKPGTA